MADTKTTDATLEDALGKFKAAWEYTQGSWHKRWEDNYRLYNNQRVNIGYVGISNVFVPMTYSTVETLVSGLYGSRPKVSFVPPNDKNDIDVEPLNAKFSEFWERDQWDLKIPETGRGKFREGTAVDYFCWDIDHPVMIHVPIRDFFIDPLATNIENARYMGRRYLTTVDELKDFEVVDPETGDMVKKYKNLDRVNDYKNPDLTDKQEKDMWYGSLMPENADQVECIELWTSDKVITIANRCAVIEDTDNYYKAKGIANGDEYAKGIMPFADDRDVIDPSLFYAKSTVDFIAGQQEQLNDLSNQLADALTYVLNQQYTIDPKYPHLQGQVMNIPGGTYLAEANTIVPIPRGTIPPDAFAQIQNIKNEIRETTGANEIIKGVGAEGAKTTATEINAQIAGAGQRIGLKVSQLENGYFHRMARIVFAMMRLYLNSPSQVKVSGSDGTRMETFVPAAYANGEYQPQVQLDITIENEKLKKSENSANMLKAFLGDMDVNQVWLKKRVLADGFDLEPDELDAAFEPNPMPEMMPGTEGMGAGAAPPEQPGMEQDPMALLESLPPEVLDSLPPDITEEELMMLIEANMAEQGAPSAA
jgi:hypothetical protein